VRILATALACLAVISAADAAVIINEVFINPPGSYDDTHEYVELLGTPGMKLDGYAVAFLNGYDRKFYLLGSIPPRPVAQEIDEFFSLDGLVLGANGLLVIGVGTQARYSTLLDDANFQRWNTIWNGGYDTPGKLQNDGSNTIMLIRNRPGETEADPSNPGGLRWGKDVAHDAELITPVEDPQEPGVFKDQWGNGALDKGQYDNIDRDTIDMRGYLTFEDVSDDLEIVDELSYEHDRGWEYDLDSRTVDIDGALPGLPERKVHALDDPQGLNPDVLTRVDYRTKGDGWAPAGGGTGQMGNGNNWQDTASEQWIRGESINGSGGEGASPWFYYSNADNDNPDAIQPYETQTPLWLDDQVGDDFDFTTAQYYQIMAGRVNPLAVTYIPGDCDRDGDCDQEDIDKLAAVFGDDDWVFSNSFADAPEGKDGDPAEQTRPWDVDGTGDNGVEASDMQWILNFQGDATGRIVGVCYDSMTPAAEGVVVNDNDGVTVAVTAALNIPSGHAASELVTGEVVELNVYAQVAAGADLTPGQENGVMQYVHDVLIGAPGVIRTIGVEALGDFNVTRAELQTRLGVDGDLGVETVNGYATAFDAGLAGPTALYRVVMKATDLGYATITVSPAGMPKFADSTPEGVKLGHTNNNGDPADSIYPPLNGVVVSAEGLLGDLDFDGDVDLSDLAALLAPYGACFGDPDYQAAADIDGDGCVNLSDLAALLANYGC